MAKRPFDIKFKPQIESGEYKVETKDGRPVEIVKWDLRSPHGSAPILAIIYGDYDCNRTYSDEGYSTIDSDRLFIVTPEEEMTEWQRFVSACLQKHGLLDCSAADRIAKNCSTELLDLARKELGNDTPSIIHAQSFNAGLKHGKQESLKDLQENLANNDIYRVPEWLREVLLMVKENGKKEALNDLPRWKKAAASFGNYSVAPTETGALCLLIDGHYIMISDLKKLPGFKENESHE